MFEIELLLRSNKLQFAGRANCSVSIEVIWLVYIKTFSNCVYWGKPDGIAVSVLLLKSKVSIAAVVEMLARIGGIAKSPRPWLAQEMVREVVLPAVAPQVQGAMKDAYCGHSQMRGVRPEAMEVPSVHIAALVPLPKFTYPWAVELRATNQLKLAQLPTVQSQESIHDTKILVSSFCRIIQMIKVVLVFEMSICIGGAVREPLANVIIAWMSGAKTASLNSFNGFDCKMMSAPQTFWRPKTAV